MLPEFLSPQYKLSGQNQQNWRHHEEVFRSARILTPFGNHPTVLSLMLQFTCSCSGDGVLKGTEQSSYQTR